MPRTRASFEPDDDLEFVFWTICLAVSAIACLWIGLIAISSEASSHSWYEVSCCSDRDCKPVADGVVVERADGVHVEGHGVLSRTDSRLRWSRDDSDHICETAATGYGTSRKLVCVYRKPNGM